MDSYIIVLTVIGLASLGMAWMPGLTEKIKISYAIFYVLLGIVLYQFIEVLPTANPLKEPALTIRLTEMVVIVSLMGTGLKIDEPFSIKRWRVPFKLVSITMLLSIALVALLGWKIFELDLAAAILLGAVLAPTDPVLASDVQVGPPLEQTKNEVRFSLTAEAGLNDGMAFPFTWLAITLALPNHEGPSIGNWFLVDFLYKIFTGCLIGYGAGKLIAFLLFTWPERHKEKAIVIREGFVAISATLLVYGFTELVHGYGFIAVFITAITIRNAEIHHKYHLALHSFTEQIERILMAIVLILLGGSVVQGIIQEISFEMIIMAAACIFLIRPITAYLSLFRTKLHFKERVAISFYGIKGMGSFFYLAFALEKATFSQSSILWSIVAFVVLCSIVIHGISATSVMNRIHKQFGRRV